MKARRRGLITILATMFVAVVVQQASAQSPLLALLESQLAKRPILLGTTGVCNSSPNANAGDPCTQASTLVLLNAQTGALIKTIGPVGYTVNGLAWDRTSFKLYASTALGCGPGSAVCPFHGLITINPFTGKGTPVDPKIKNFGLEVGPLGEESPVHSIAIDPSGNMVGWYDEVSPPDTYVRINQRTGVATEFPNTGINTNANGVAFGQFNLLWNINSPQCNGTNCGPGGADLTQTAYILNPFTGKQFASVPVTPPTMAALGDFLPGTNRYYGLKFNGLDPNGTTLIEKIDLDLVLGTGTVTTLGPTVNFLHTLAFIP